MLSDRARSARSENLHPQTQMSCHIATFAKDPGPVVSCHVATFAKNLGINDIDICPNPRDKYAQGKHSHSRNVSPCASQNSSADICVICLTFGT